MTEERIYATPRSVTDLKDCYFYHTMDIPGYGHVKGHWDLRPGAREYLGRVDLRGKRVLEVGAASGFLTFYMEQQGADVVALDVSPEDGMDLVPFARAGNGEFATDQRELLDKVDNAFWLCHRAFESRVKKVYGTAYQVPAGIGPFDVAVFGSLLLHLRDPFLALQSGLRITRETVVVTEALFRKHFMLQLAGRVTGPIAKFLPRPESAQPRETWWALTPEIIKRFIAVLGFERAAVRYHVQNYEGRRRPLFTVVGTRTAGAPAER